MKNQIYSCRKIQQLHLSRKFFIHERETGNTKA